MQHCCICDLLKKLKYWFGRILATTFSIRVSDENAATFRKLIYIIKAIAVWIKTQTAITFIHC